MFYWSVGIVPNIKSNNKHKINYMINKTVPEHRRCRWVPSSGLERVLQGEQDSPGLSDLSKAIDPAPKM